MSKNYFCVRKRDFNKLQIFHKNRQLTFEVFKIKYLFKHLRKFKFRPSDSFFHRSLNPAANFLCRAEERSYVFRPKSFTL